MTLDKGNVIKICLIGNSRVGKSSIAEQLVHKVFSEKTKNTGIGKAYLHKYFQVEGEPPVNVHIWDTAGEEKYHSLAPMYFRNASGMVMVYDITDKKSFQRLPNYWLPQVRSILGQSIPLAVVGNKVDLEETDRAVLTKDANAFAESLDAVFLEASAKTGRNVERVFTELILKIREFKLRRLRGGDDEMEARDVTNIADEEQKSSSSSCTCH